MKERLTAIVIISVAVVGICGLLNLSAMMTGAQTADGHLLVSGYLDDNEDNNDPMCESRMTAVARPGNRLIGQGMATGIRYYIDFQPGWEQSSSIDFYVYDVSPVLCVNIPITNFTNSTNGKKAIDLRCEFENINCFYYIEYDHIEGEAEKYWGKVEYIGGTRQYR